jgi:hypothetical protein
MSFEADSEITPLTPDQEAQLRALATDRAPELLAALNTADSAESRFYALPDAALAAYRLGNLGHAVELAAEALELARSYPDNWNFGNALHLAHTVQGLVALGRDDVGVAVDELASAGATPGSPQLDSFGPSMELARALLKRGQTEPVLKYLAQCRVFWKMGTTWLNLWEPMVRAGRVPNCFMNAYR